MKNDLYSLIIKKIIKMMKEAYFLYKNKIIFLISLFKINLFLKK